MATDSPLSGKLINLRLVGRSCVLRHCNLTLCTLVHKLIMDFHPIHLHEPPYILFRLLSSAPSDLSYAALLTRGQECHSVLGSSDQASHQAFRLCFRAARKHEYDPYLRAKTGARKSGTSAIPVHISRCAALWAAMTNVVVLTGARDWAVR